MQTRPHRLRHQRMVGRMELDLVDAVAHAVMGVQLRRVGIGQPGVRLHGRRAQALTQARKAVGGQAGRMKAQRVAQRRVRVEQVVAAQRVGLVEHVVGDVHASLHALIVKSA